MLVGYRILFSDRNNCIFLFPIVQLQRVVAIVENLPGASLSPVHDTSLSLATGSAGVINRVNPAFNSLKQKIRVCLVLINV